MGKHRSKAKRTVALVEDNRSIRNLVEVLLSEAGHEAVIFRDGIEALPGIAEADPDLVLLDLRLPEIDGFEILRQLRRDPRTEKLRIVAFTAQAMFGDRERVMAAGFDGYMSKPVEPEAFAEAVDGFLS